MTLFLLLVPLIFIGKTLLQDRMSETRHERSRQLRIAASFGRMEEVKSLVESGVNVNLEREPVGAGNTPLWSALVNGHWDCADYLVSKGARTDAHDPRCPSGYLLLAVSRGARSNAWEDDQQLTWARRLIAEGHDIQYCEFPYHHTPLHIAASYGAVKLVRELVERGADVYSRMKGGETPLYLAAQGGHAEIVRLLLQHGADPTLTGGEYHINPLHAAQHRNRVEVVRLLKELRGKRHP